MKLGVQIRVNHTYYEWLTCIFAIISPQIKFRLCFLTILCKFFLTLVIGYNALCLALFTESRPEMLPVRPCTVTVQSKASLSNLKTESF